MVYFYCRGEEKPLEGNGGGFLERRSVRSANFVFMSCVFGVVLGAAALSIAYAYFPDVIGKYQYQLSAFIMLAASMLPVICCINSRPGRVFAPAFSLSSLSMSVLLILPMAVGGFFFFTGLNALFVILTDVLGLSKLAVDSVSALSDTGMPLAWKLVLIAVFPGIIEESVFRGILQPAYAHLGKWKAIFLSAALFALLHGQPIAAPAQLAIGLLLGLIAWQSGSVIPAMIYHALHNGISLVVYEYASKLAQAYEASESLSGALSEPAAVILSAVSYIIIGAVIGGISLAAFIARTNERGRPGMLSSKAGKKILHGKAGFTYVPLILGIAGIALYNIILTASRLM